MKNFCKLFLILTFILNVLFSIASCSNNPSGNEAEKSSDTSESERGEATDGKILPDLPAMDFGGHEFRILTFGVQGSDQWENIDLTPREEDNGEIINDAVFTRNAAVEERYNITLKEVHSYDFTNDLKKDHSSGEHRYDLYSPRLIDSANYISSGYFYNMLNAEYLDLEKPWYNQQGIAEMTLDNKLYIIMSDALLSDNDATSCIVFNKSMIQDLGLENPYTLVDSGKWTVDSMYAMAKSAAFDIDGDGKMTNATDRFGFLTMNDTMVSFLHSGGGKLCGKDEYDLPVLVFNDENNFVALNKSFDLLYDGFVTRNTQKPGSEAMEKTFSEDRSAFMWIRMYMIPKLRTMETDFGIIPIPKVYESQEKYVNTINVHHACTLAIPYISDNAERASIILEALAAESKYTVQPAYYEVSLKTKHSRDDESAAMLDLIFANTMIDIGDIYNFADFGNGFYQLAQTDDRNLASFYEKYETKVNKEIGKMISNLEKLD